MSKRSRKVSCERRTNLGRKLDRDEGRNLVLDVGRWRARGELLHRLVSIRCLPVDCLDSVKLLCVFLSLSNRCVVADAALLARRLLLELTALALEKDKDRSTTSRRSYPNCRPRPKPPPSPLPLTTTTMTTRLTIRTTSPITPKRKLVVPINLSRSSLELRD